MTKRRGYYISDKLSSLILQGASFPLSVYWQIRDLLKADNQTSAITALTFYPNISICSLPNEKIVIGYFWTLKQIYLGELDDTITNLILQAKDDKIIIDQYPIPIDQEIVALTQGGQKFYFLLSELETLKEEAIKKIEAAIPQRIVSTIEELQVLI